MTLVRVVAPHFVAGLMMHRDRCVQAAPILRWAERKPWYQIKQYLERRRWEYEARP